MMGEETFVGRKWTGSDVVGVAAAIVVCELAGVIGALFTAPAIPTWYASIEKPFFTPPSWVFGPVWTTLYALMGVSVYLVWRSRKRHANAGMALTVFAVQLVFNTLWSIAFFGLKSPLLGLAVIGLLWVSIAATIFLFWKNSRTASSLLFPYIAWVSFAALLNAAIYVLNR